MQSFAAKRKKKREQQRAKNRAPGKRQRCTRLPAGDTLKAQITVLYVRYTKSLL
jgi:hypothetical protein